MLIKHCYILFFNQAATREAPPLFIVLHSCSGTGHVQDPLSSLLGVVAQHLTDLSMEANVKLSTNEWQQGNAAIQPRVQFLLKGAMCKIWPEFQNTNCSILIGWHIHWYDVYQFRTWQQQWLVSSDFYENTSNVSKRLLFCTNRTIFLYTINNIVSLFSTLYSHPNSIFNSRAPESQHMANDETSMTPPNAPTRQMWSQISYVTFLGDGLT